MAVCLDSRLTAAPGSSRVGAVLELGALRADDHGVSAASILLAHALVAAPLGLTVEELLPAPLVEDTGASMSVVTGLELDKLARQQVATVMWEWPVLGDLTVNGALPIAGATRFGQDPLEDPRMAGTAKVGAYTKAFGIYVGAEVTTDPDWTELALWVLHVGQWRGLEVRTESAFFAGTAGAGFEVETKLTQPLGTIDATVALNALLDGDTAVTIAPGLVAEPIDGHRIHASIAWPLHAPDDIDAVTFGVAYEARL